MSSISKACRGLLCGAALIALPTSALGQSTTANAADPYNSAATVSDRTVTTTHTEEHDKDFPWGLLGLLGLGGLLGRKRHNDAPDINVDARRDKRT